MEASDLKKLKALEEENRKLKRIYAELALDRQMALEIIEKKALKPYQKRDISQELSS